MAVRKHVRDLIDEFRYKATTDVFSVAGNLSDLAPVGC